MDQTPGWLDSHKTRDKATNRRWPPRATATSEAETATETDGDLVENSKKKGKTNRTKAVFKVPHPAILTTSRPEPHAHPTETWSTVTKRGAKRVKTTTSAQAEVYNRPAAELIKVDG
jgi:hypothetical protein